MRALKIAPAECLNVLTFRTILQVLLSFLLGSKIKSPWLDVKKVVLGA
jgi:hypothetical protein